MNNSGLLLVVSGPSGAGKSTTLRAAMEKEPNLIFSVSATTRAPRPGEDEQSYQFMSREEFVALRDSDQLLEHAEFAGNFYGTPKSPVVNAIAAGKIAVLDIEAQGALQVRERMPDSVLVFLCPADISEVERRLRGRNTETEEKILRRMIIAREQMKYVRHYDYVIHNDDLELAQKALRSIVTAERHRMSRQESLWPECTGSSG